MVIGELRKRGTVRSVTLETWGPEKHPSRTLDSLLKAVEGLKPEMRELWDKCIERSFDLGFECSDENFADYFSVDTALLHRIVAVKGTLAITIYRASQAETFP